MPGVLEKVDRIGKPRGPVEATILAAHTPPTHDHRSMLFFVCDLVFLVLAGIAATLTMHLVHQLEWPFIPTSLIGMIAAMLVQTLMAVAVAPLIRIRVVPDNHRNTLRSRNNLADLLAFRGMYE